MRFSNTIIIRRPVHDVFEYGDDLVIAAQDQPPRQHRRVAGVGLRARVPTRHNTNSVVLSPNPLIFPTGNEVPKAEVVAAWAGRLQYPSRFRRTDAVPRDESVEITFDR